MTLTDSTFRFNDQKIVINFDNIAYFDIKKQDEQLQKIYNIFDTDSEKYVLSPAEIKNAIDEILDLESKYGNNDGKIDLNDEYEGNKIAQYLNIESLDDLKTAFKNLIDHICPQLPTQTTLNHYNNDKNNTKLHYEILGDSVISRDKNAIGNTKYTTYEYNRYTQELSERDTIVIEGNTKTITRKNNRGKTEEYIQVLDKSGKINTNKETAAKKLGYKREFVFCFGEKGLYGYQFTRRYNVDRDIKFLTIRETWQEWDNEVKGFVKKEKEVHWLSKENNSMQYL